MSQAQRSDRRSLSYSRLFERVIAVSGFLAAVMTVTTLLLGVLFVGASLDMLADPRPCSTSRPSNLDL